MVNFFCFFSSTCRKKLDKASRSGFWNEEGVQCRLSALPASRSASAGPPEGRERASFLGRAGVCFLHLIRLGPLPCTPSPAPVSASSCRRRRGRRVGRGRRVSPPPSRKARSVLLRTSRSPPQPSGRHGGCPCLFLLPGAGADLAGAEEGAERVLKEGGWRRRGFCRARKDIPQLPLEGLSQERRRQKLWSPARWAPSFCWFSSRTTTTWSARSLRPV